MRLSTQLILAFSIILILSLIDSLSNYFLSVKVEQNTRFFNKSQEIIRNSTQLHKEVIEMQSSFRGFLLTEDTGFLDNYNKALLHVPPLMRQQRGLVRENFTQLSILDTIQDLHRQWISYANALIRARKQATESAASVPDYQLLIESKLKKHIGKKLNDEISKKFNAFDQIEYKIRLTYSANLIESIRRTHMFSFIFVMLTILIGTVVTFYIVSRISRRIDKMVQFAQNISEGEFTRIEDDKKDELTGLSDSLNNMSASLKKNISELERKNAELDKFAYAVSHDLKAPVRGIRNVVKWIEEDLEKEISPQMKKYLDIIPLRTKRMEDLINGLLEYARVRQKTNPEVTDVAALLNEIVETVVPRNFSVEIGAMPTLMTERLKLEIVFTNLISNAVKYSSPENPAIAVTCNEFSGLYEFAVKDNGIGIEPEYHEKIFEIFQTLKEKGDEESTGIGLTITKKILDDLGESIRVVSAPGKGSEFIFTWPRNHPS